MRTALDVLLEKRAQGQDVPDWAPDVAVAGAGMAAPFAGLIGESPITKDPFFNPNIRRVSSRELGRLARPGDVVLMSRRAGQGGRVTYKVPQEWTTGSEFYHAEPVAYKTRGSAETLAAGSPYPRALSSLVGTVKDPEYPEAALLRPKKKFTPSELEAYTKALDRATEKPYSGPQGAKALLKDIFVPKVGRGKKIIPASKAICNEYMCSSLPAGVHAEITGKNIIKGKTPQMVLPADFFRESSLFEPVAASMTNPPIATSRTRLLKRIGLRAGLGAPIAGAGLLAYNEPEAFGGVAAGIGAPMAVRAATQQLRHNKKLRQILKKRFGVATHKGILSPQSKKMFAPSLTRDIVPVFQDTFYRHGRLPTRKEILGDLKNLSKSTKGLLTRFGTRSLPLSLGAGVGTYALLKQLMGRD